MNPLLVASLNKTVYVNIVSRKVLLLVVTYVVMAIISFQIEWSLFIALLNYYTRIRHYNNLFVVQYDIIYYIINFITLLYQNVHLLPIKIIIIINPSIDDLICRFVECHLRRVLTRTMERWAIIWLVSGITWPWSLSPPQYMTAHNLGMESPLVP